MYTIVETTSGLPLYDRPFRTIGAAMTAHGKLICPQFYSIVTVERVRYTYARATLPYVPTYARNDQNRGL